MTTAGPTVLVIEDELQIRKFLRISLTNQGFHVVEAVTGQEGVAQAAACQPDLIILDLGLPDMDGMEVLRQVREWSRLPVVVLSARGKENDKIDALDAGADDYLTKPFGVGELLARVRVALRHAAVSGEEGEPEFRVGELCVDFAHRRVFVGEAEVHLTPTEYRLLTVLVKHAGKVVTHRQLLKDVWGPDSVFENQYLRLYVGHVRRKLEADAARPRYLLTEPGVGYRLAVE